MIDYHAGLINTIVVAEFFALFACCVWVGIGTVRRSQDAADDLWRLPPTDRVLLSAAVFAVALVFLDIIRLRLAPAWLEPLWPAEPSHWSVAVIRGLPLPALGWFAVRVNGVAPAARFAPVVPHRSGPCQVISDNARRAVRFAIAGAAAGGANELCERNDVYHLMGFAETFGVVAWMMVVVVLWEATESRLGVRIFGPLDRGIGEEALGKPHVRSVPE